MHNFLPRNSFAFKLQCLCQKLDPKVDRPHQDPKPSLFRKKVWHTKNYFWIASQSCFPQVQSGDAICDSMTPTPIVYPKGQLSYKKFYDEM